MWEQWQGWLPALWLILGAVALVWLSKRVVRRARSALMTAALVTYLGGSFTALNIGDYLGPEAVSKCAAVSAESLDIRNAPGQGLCKAREAFKSVGLISA